MGLIKVYSNTKSRSLRLKTLNFRCHSISTSHSFTHWQSTAKRTTFTSLILGTRRRNAMGCWFRRLTMA
jgi:hypothetical protein